MGGIEVGGRVMNRYKVVIFLAFVLVMGYLYIRQHSVNIQPTDGRPSIFYIGQLKDVQDSFEDIRFVEENLYSLFQDDPRLIKYVRGRYITPPSDGKYNKVNMKWSSDHTALIIKLFKNKRNGVFLESGANTGEKTHTFKLENELGWTGLLVECNPTVVPYLNSRHRKAWVAGVCLSLGKVPAKYNFSNPVSWTYSGRLGKPWNVPKNTTWTFFDVESVPLYTVLEAVGIKDIDYWSLDVEGSEFSILKSVPFDKVKIKVIICEIYFFSTKERAELDKFMKGKGYRIYDSKFAIDRVYIHKSFKT